ncbi:MAG: hypothetical protein JST04_09975 [Bdellovibrionales bacterium]|nr:hypothetical protein [Bdellovibrionales bacterium]
MKRLGEGIRGLVNASGGVGYHLAALRFASRLWEPFREELARELARRFPSPESTDLVVVGPSGGYCLDPAFFRRFRRIVAVDMDPLAGAILRSRLAPDADRFRFVRQDFLRRLGEEGWDLGAWTRGLGGEAVLFSNLLGQLGFLHGEARMREIGAGLARALGGETPWVSFHDRFSVGIGAPRVSLEFASRPGSRELADAWTAKWDASARGIVGEIEEHEIGEWVNGARGPFRYLSWRLEARRTQLIEVCGKT